MLDVSASALAVVDDLFNQAVIGISRRKIASSSQKQRVHKIPGQDAFGSVVEVLDSVMVITEKSQKANDVFAQGVNMIDGTATEANHRLH